MTASLKIRIDRSLPFTQVVELAGKRLEQMLKVHREFRICFQAPTGVSFSEVPNMIPNHPRWGMYFYLEDVNDSLVDSHLSTISSSFGQEPVVLHLEERRTPASKALTASLAIAAAELLGQDILDDACVWGASSQVSPYELQRQLTSTEFEETLDSALDKFVRRMGGRGTRSEPPKTE